MRRIIRRKKSGYALGFVLFSTGLIVLFAVLWKSWPNVSASDNALSALELYLWTEQFNFIPGVTFKLVYVTAMGVFFLAFGLVVLAFSRQVFSVTGDESVLLRCPYCKNNWKANRAKAWAECPHCRQFIRPTVVKSGQ
jgi:hypothetical protein